MEERLVVVDVVDADDDLGGAAERVWAAGRVIVGGGDVEDVLRSPEPGGGASSQLDDACTFTHTHTLVFTFLFFFPHCFEQTAFY